MISTAERRVVQALADAWNEFLKIPPSHADMQTEFRYGIHALQNMILARSTIRELEKEDVQSSG